MILILEPASLSKHDATSPLFATWNHKKKHDRYKWKELVRNKKYFDIIADVFKIVKKMEKYPKTERKDNFGSAKEIDNVLNSKIADL